jgi:hypothetical protein
MNFADVIKITNLKRTCVPEPLKESLLVRGRKNMAEGKARERCKRKC